MKEFKALMPKKTTKGAREKRVLLALIDLYIATGKPVGSHALKEAGIEDLSAATIRNYFAQLEKEGYLTQQHTSGGRLPTDLAFRFYAHEEFESDYLSEDAEAACQKIRNEDSKEIALSLQKASEALGLMTNCAVFVSAPRFDHDFITAIKLVAIDHCRAYCIMITDFGLVKGELIQVEKKLSAFTTKRLEEYFHWRLTGLDYPGELEEEESQLAQRIYNEVMVRYIVSYANFLTEEIYRTGFSRLVIYPEFQDPACLASSLALFENLQTIRLFSRECCAIDRLKFWIGSDLDRGEEVHPNCAMVVAPYHINKQPVGALGLLGPIRMPYRKIFGVLRAFTNNISEALTRNVYKFKIQHRQPQEKPFILKENKEQLLEKTHAFLLEDMRSV